MTFATELTPSELKLTRYIESVAKDNPSGLEAKTGISLRFNYIVEKERNVYKLFQRGRMYFNFGSSNAERLLCYLENVPVENW